MLRVFIVRFFKGNLCHLPVLNLDLNQELLFFHWINLNIAKVGGLQNQDAKGEAIVGYCDPSATPDLKSTGFCKIRDSKS